MQNDENRKEGNNVSVLKHGDTDMTEGSILRHLILFALPLLVGNLFQQLYNTVDSIVVGNYVSKQALAAVGCTTPVINTLIGVFTGLATGAGVVISQHFGAKDKEKLFDAVQTTMALTGFMCVLLTVVGVCLTPAMLRLMSTPEDVFAEAVEYLRIYFWGVSGLLLYNIGAGILRAVGDSTHPLYYLIFSAASNTVLDVLFVKYFRWGIAGAAYATIGAQFMSAILVMSMLIRTRAPYRVDIAHPRCSRSMLRRICSIGFPSSVQLGVTAFGNIFTMSYMNRFGSDYVAGWTACSKVDSFANLPMSVIFMALVTFVGQNLGAGKYKRVKTGPYYALLMGFVIILAVLVPLMLFAPQISTLFSKDPEVIRYSAYFLRLISPFYFFFAINQVFSGTLRGAGNSTAAMIIALSSFVAFRQLYLYIASRYFCSVLSIAIAYPLGWIVCSVIITIYYYCSGWMDRFVRE